MSSIETIHTNNLSQVKNIDGKTWTVIRSSSEPRRGRKGRNESFWDLLSRSQSENSQNEHKRTKTSSFQDPNSQSQHMYGKNDWKRANLVPFKTIIQDTNWRNDKMSSFQDPNWQVCKKDKISSFQDLLSRPLLHTMLCMAIKIHFKTFFLDPCIKAL